MAGNFHGVQIFVIFIGVVNLVVTKINIYVLCESMMMGVATNIVAVRPTLSSISKQQ